MQNTDREEFNALLRKFMGGYDAFPNPDKIEAYWTGLQKMTLPQLSRIIDHALSEEGPDKLPNVHGVWDLHREMRRSGSNGIAPVHDAPPGEKPVATLQEQLCAYAMDHLHLTPHEIAAPWEYTFSEWWVERQRNSALTGVRITRETQVVSTLTVAQMYADTEGHARVMAMFKRVASRSNGLAKTGVLIAPDVPSLELSGSIEDAVSPAEEKVAANFFDEPVTW